MSKDRMEETVEKEQTGRGRGEQCTDQTGGEQLLSGGGSFASKPRAIWDCFGGRTLRGPKGPRESPRQHRYPSAGHGRAQRGQLPHAVATASL